jgi:hypothetical protein
MTLGGVFKDDRTIALRSALKATPGIRETDRAEAGLTTLSFASAEHPQRNVWIDTDLNGQLWIDLEDLRDERAWDHAVAHVTPPSDDAAIQVVQAWLSGMDLQACLTTASPKRST